MAPGTDPAAADLGLAWVARGDQAAVGLALAEQVEVAEALALQEAAGALACGIPVYRVAAVAQEQAREGPVKEVDPEAVARVWAVLEGEEAELVEDLALVAGVVLEVVGVPERAVELGPAPEVG